MEEKKIIVARYKTLPYKVNYEDNGIKKPYSWSGSKGKIIDKKLIPESVVNWIIQNSVAFNEKELIIIEDEDENAKEIADNIENIEEIRKTTYTKEEIIKVLNGNFMKMKKKLNEITSKNDKDFICNVAQEIKLDSIGKQKFLAEWADKKREILFEE